MAADVKNGKKVAKNVTNRTKEFIKKDKLKNSTNNTIKASVSDDEDENSAK